MRCVCAAAVAIISSGEPKSSAPPEWCSPNQTSSKPSRSRWATSATSRWMSSVGMRSGLWIGGMKTPKRMPGILSAGQRDLDRDDRSGAGRALDLQVAVELGDAVGETDEPAPLRPGAAAAVVAHADRERAVGHVHGDLGALGARVLGDVGQR